MKPARLIFVSPHNPRDPQKWSGTIYSIYCALSIGDQRTNIKIINADWITACGRALNRILRTVGINNIDCRFSTAFALAAGVYVSLRLALLQEGTIVAVAASNYLAYARTRKPIIYISDATFRAICDLYADFKSFPGWLRQQGERSEAISLQKARHIIYPSKWASLSAQSDYGVASDRILQLPFGPNIPDETINKNYSVKIAPSDEVRIVFVSADWKRKNGDQVVEICRCLINAGAKVRLITIGKTPAHVQQIDFVDDRGFLHKSNPQQLAAICAAYREAHFLLLPTLADAFGIVFSEAQAFGVPPVSYDVGGVGSAIENGKTGLLFPLGTSSEIFAKEMMRYIKDAGLYRELSEGCRTWYLERANWSNWAKLILELAAKSVSSH